MSKYLIEFEKTGYMQFISHLDLQRLFRRTIRRLGYNLAYSQGYNPHPKFAMAQPLSLGYVGRHEYFEVEIVEEIEPDLFVQAINNVLPEGIRLLSGRFYPDGVKSVGATCYEAVYTITYPDFVMLFDAITLENFMKQDEIIAEKRQKKTKKMIKVNIKDKIRELKSNDRGNEIIARLDCGSVSNLSPEQLIQGINSFFNIKIGREKIMVSREKMHFNVEI
ncbi:MAG: TIGR03936 family radical SAM-associated protein [Peptostreptococcaceae bacterium]|nr:TIGR03936 family radical SAM-associated protein [Peptostreptococcaceae bacterium]MDY5739556.1 TIGR03936 family radical SAM-associated protein [Anaerovoracaceae bacterium]